jgi:serpin B
LFVMENVQSWTSIAKGSMRSLQVLGARLLEKECSRKPHENVFLSPLSIFLALSMLEKGAKGHTKAAIRGALALSEEATDKSSDIALAELVRDLYAQTSIEFSVANALWAHVASAISPEYVKLCTGLYDAEAHAIDFTRHTGAIAIKTWIRQKTNGNIPQLVTSVDIRNTLALITSAVYFKGKFRCPFWKESTKPQPFHLANGTEKVVPMMERNRMSDVYWRGDRYEAAELRYTNAEIALILILPAKGLTPEEVLTKQCLSGMYRQMDRAIVFFKVPRFTIDYESVLKQTLTELGMGVAFGSEADFSSIHPQSLSIGDFLHKAHLNIDEQGSLAAAATGVLAEPTAAYDPNIPPFEEVVFDRPFAVLLKDAKYGAILFAGVVYDP